MKDKIDEMHDLARELKTQKRLVQMSDDVNERLGADALTWTTEKQRLETEIQRLLAQPHIQSRTSSSETPEPPNPPCPQSPSTRPTESTAHHRQGISSKYACIMPLPEPETGSNTRHPAPGTREMEGSQLIE